MLLTDEDIDCSSLGDETVYVEDYRNGEKERWPVSIAIYIFSSSHGSSRELFLAKNRKRVMSISSNHLGFRSKPAQTRL